MCVVVKNSSLPQLTTNYFRIKRRNDTISFITECFVAKRNVQPYSKEKCTAITCHIYTKARVVNLQRQEIKVTT